MLDELSLGYPVVVRQAVVWGEMDSYRHVNNVVYFRYFENARLEYFRRLGWPAFEQETGIGPILASTQARFRRALTYPDTIAITAKLRTLGEDRLTLEHRIFSEQLGELATEGEGVIVTFHYARGEKVPLPEVIRQRIAALEGASSPPLG
jgi:acyl-CoA thioester hydrolase